MLSSHFSVRQISLILFTFLYFLRRPADALYPSVWVEDGLFNIPQAISNGWSSLFIPVNGYLIIPSKFITLLSLSTSGIFYPEIAYLLTLAITLGVLVILTSSYLAVKGKEFLPLIIVLLPYDPEVFSTPLYIFWWTSLLLMIPLLSPKSQENHSTISTYTTHLLAVVIGCVSSPICIILLPVMGFRAYVTRERLDYLVFVIWTLLAAVQFWFSLNIASAGVSQTINNIQILKLAIPKYFGNYIWYHGWLAADTWLIYILAALFIGVGVWMTYRAIRFRHLEAFYISAALMMTLGAIASSWLRVGIIADPVLGGPRYFFFPYIFLSLFLLAIFSQTKNSIVQFICIAIITVSCTLSWITGFPNFFRIHDPIDWRLELSACLASPPSYPLSIQYDGNRALAWKRAYSYEECQKIANSGVFASVYGLNESTLGKFR